MGAVIPPELGSSDGMQPPYVHSNGNGVKLGVSDSADDAVLSPANGATHELENLGKLNGISDLDGESVDDGTVDLAASPVAGGAVNESDSSDAPVPEERYIAEHLHDQEVEAMDPETTAGSGSLESDLKSNAAGPESASSNGEPGWSTSDSTCTVADGTSAWEVSGVHAGWEVVEDGAVLGTGSSNEEKAIEPKQPLAAKELYTYYMVRIPKPIDTKGKTEIRMAELRLKEKQEKRDFITAAVQMKRASRNEALDKLRAARDKERGCKDAFRAKLEELGPLQDARRKINVARNKSRDLPASEEELDERIAYVEYRIQHESMPLKEEKQLLRDIKSLKACREEVCKNAALNAGLQEALGQREEIEERLKPLNNELDAIKTEMHSAAEKTIAIEADFRKLDDAVNQLQAQWVAANHAREDVYRERSNLMRQENLRNEEFYQNRAEIQKVKGLAFQNQKNLVEELCNAQVERVLGMWNSNAEFRAAYVKSNERSTLKRLQTFDGRSLGPDEEPPLVPAANDDAFPGTTVDIPAVVAPQASARKETSKLKGHVKTSEPSAMPTIPISNGDKQHGGELAVSLKSPLKLARGSESSLVSSEKASKSEDQEMTDEVELAAVELKEKRRQQEMAKAKEAEERKKRLAERSQAKALARAQKDAERREKEREKKARRKASLSSVTSNHRDPALTDMKGEEEAEQAIVAPVQELPAEIKQSSKLRKRSVNTQKIKPAKGVLNAVAKKGGAGMETWVYISAAAILIFGVLIVLMRLFGSSKSTTGERHSSHA